MTKVFLALALAAFAPVMRADLIFTATLLPGNEVPPNNTVAKGFIVVDLHTDLITLDVTETFSGLTVNASAAHIHCCGPVGVNEPVVLPFTGFPTTTSGNYAHTFNLNTDLSGITAATLVAALQNGSAYANIHNATFPGGEIRGQLALAPEPTALFLVGGGLLTVFLGRKRLARATV